MHHISQKSFGFDVVVGFLLLFPFFFFLLSGFWVWRWFSVLFGFIVVFSDFLFHLGFVDALSTYKPP